jgi:hypothetical protein
MEPGKRAFEREEFEMRIREAKLFPIVEDVLKAGGREWTRNGELHRDDDLPAVDYGDYKAWYQCGKKHRDGDKPAATWDDQPYEWYQRGQLHRDGDLPAVIHAGVLEWWQYGQRHPLLPIRGSKGSLIP